MSFFRRKKEKKPADLPIKGSGGNIKRTPSTRSTPSPLSQNGDIAAEGALLDFGSTGRPVKLVIEEEVYDPGDLGNSKSTQSSSLSTSSRLSKSIEEVLRDKDALTCFIHFMESRKAGALIRFWCDADSFQAATWSRIRTHTLNVTKQNTLSQHNKQQSSESRTTSDTPQAGLSSNNLTDEGDPNSLGSSQTLLEETSSLDVIPAEESSALSNKDSPSGAPIYDTGQNETVAPVRSISNDPSTPSPVIPSVTTSNSTNSESSCATLTNISTDGASSSENRRWSPLESKSSDVDAAVPTSRPMRTKSISSTDLAEKLKKSVERDAVNIFQKYLSHDASHPVGISDQLRNECIRKICREDGEVDPNCFFECQSYIVDKMNKEYFTEFLSSEFHYRHQVNVLTGSTASLNDILYNEGSLFYFMEYMEQEGGVNLLQFWLAVDNFHNHLVSLGDKYDGAEAQKDAMVIYDKYFSLQASHPLGFDDKIRFEVEGNICREEGPLPECFAKPRSIVLKTMEKLYFPGFLQSDIFYKYLSELVSTVQIASDLPKQSKHRRQDSDASSVHSTHSGGSETVSQKNTLLAMDTSHLRKNLQKLQESEMNIDAGLLHPELLWKRNDASLSLGKVDSLGRFVSEFDPKPDQEKSKGSGLFKKKKKKEQEEEEMALQIAQMIIKDVTSVTQAIGAMKNPEPGMEMEIPEPQQNKTMQDKAKS